MSDSATPWTAARQASLSITNSRSLLTLMSIESMMPSNHLILLKLKFMESGDCVLLVFASPIFPDPVLASKIWYWYFNHKLVHIFKYTVV